MTVQYKGFVIAPETEPWRTRDGFMFYVRDEGSQGPDDCSHHDFRTIEEAKEFIDGIVEDDIVIG